MNRRYDNHNSLLYCHQQKITRAYKKRTLLVLFITKLRHINSGRRGKLRKINGCNKIKVRNACIFEQSKKIMIYRKYGNIFVVEKNKNLLRWNEKHPR